jgi:peroxiredoxin
VVISSIVVFLLAAQAAGAEVSPADLNRIQVGQPAPDFTALTPEGKPARLSDYRGKNVVLVFYRGHW